MAVVFRLVKSYSPVMMDVVDVEDIAVDDVVS